MSSLPPPPVAAPDHIGPVPDDPRRWGLGDMWLGLAASIAAVAVIGSIALAAGGYDGLDDVPMWLFSLINAPLHLALALVAVWAVTEKGRGVIADLRFTFEGWQDAGTGVLVGVLAQIIVVPVVTVPVLWLIDRDLDDVGESARELADRANDPVGVVALVITTCILAPVVEEVFFRGLVFGAYKKRANLRWLARLVGRPGLADGRRWNLAIAALFSSALFSAVHFNPLLFPALFAVGGVFAWLAQRYGRLGPAIWAHVAFNATTILALLT